MSRNGKLADKVALVTGGSAGIGRAYITGIELFVDGGAG
jgi:NADP-dependent 3-hydroxy acid dehydrogenase YdfG